MADTVFGKTIGGGRSTVIWFAGVAVLVAASWWSFTNPGGYHLIRAGLFLLAAVGLNHLRMRRDGSTRRWLKSLLFLDFMLTAALVWTLSTADPNAVESLAIFIVPILFVCLLLTGFVVVVALVRRDGDQHV